MKQHYEAVSLAILLALTVAVAQLSLSAKANMYIPEPETKIEIDNPHQNEICTNSTITLTFYVRQASWWINFSYSLDGQEIKIVENLRTIKVYYLNGIPIADLRGSCVLGNLSEGWHNVTVCQLGPYYGNPKLAKVVHSAFTQFRIAGQQPSESFPIAVATVSGASIAAVAAGAVVYWTKRKREAAPS